MNRIKGHALCSPFFLLLVRFIERFWTSPPGKFFTSNSFTAFFTVAAQNAWKPPSNNSQYQCPPNKVMRKWRILFCRRFIEVERSKCCHQVWLASSSPGSQNLLLLCRFLVFASLALILALRGNSWLLKMGTVSDLSHTLHPMGSPRYVDCANKVAYLILPECSVKHFVTLFWKALNRSINTHFNRRH